MSILSQTQCSAISPFCEQEFLKKGHKGSVVVVFFMIPGFNAEDMVHGTVIPRKIARCLVILYWLDIVVDTFAKQDTQDYKEGKTASMS